MTERRPANDGLATRVAQTTYRGIWVVLRDWFRVPQHPPSLPLRPGMTLSSFRPSEGYFRYLTLLYWIFILFLGGVLLVALVIASVANPLLGAILALPFLVIVGLPGVLGYIALRLRVDTMWYVMSDRSIRLRRGIWVIQEVTITFENVQNVTVAQGPLQRAFGIADVAIQTAGGGAVGPHGAPGAGHHGIIEGIADAERLRDVILAKVKASRHAGLGDEHPQAVHAATPTTGGAWTPERLAVLREIRDLVAARRVTGTSG